MTILVTGGAGFIGSNFLQHLKIVTDEEIVCVDKLTYAGKRNNVPSKAKLYVADIAGEDAIKTIFERHDIKTVFHFAAESHVDNSIKDCSEFIRTNIVGTVNLLNASLKHNVEKFMHISTDEVYGSIENGSFTEKTNYDPRNPYSASKASSDHFVRAFHNTYGLPTVITNCSNNYGPRQHKEKLIPQTILNLLNDKKIPVYGDGKQIRDWLYVQDHCEALIEVWKHGVVGEKYNIGGECEVQNIDLIKKIISLMGKDESMIEYVKDRPGHDRRYSTDISKITKDLNWKPRFDINDGLTKTIEWYERHRD
ncbi:MAG: dTDP-glucose 4,6-dehydratase [Candidatus Poseidoniales archaeon]